MHETFSKMFQLTCMLPNADMHIENKRISFNVHKCKIILVLTSYKTLITKLNRKMHSQDPFKTLMHRANFSLSDSPN